MVWASCAAFGLAARAGVAGGLAGGGGGAESLVVTTGAASPVERPLARTTSSFVMRPRSPEPRTSSRFTSRSSASLRMVGLASALPVALRDAASCRSGDTSPEGTTPLRRGAGALGEVETLGASARVPVSALSSIWQRTAFTATTSPSCARIFTTRPPCGAGSSLSALSVAISTSGSSFRTMSPSRTRHLLIVPSDTLSPSCGMMTSMTIGRISSSGRDAPFLPVSHPPLPAG